MTAYLDYNASAPMRPEVVAVMQQAMSAAGNPSSVHRFGRRAHRLVEDAREAVAALAGVAADGVVFTGGGTEANNLALTGTTADRHLVSAIEHDSVLNGTASATLIPVGPDGRVDLARLGDLLDQTAKNPGEPALVSVMAANNETGVIQPIAEIADLVHRHGARLHSDAIQAAGKIGLKPALLGADLVSLSAHKLGGPQGVGALVVADDGPVRPLLRGGGQERGRRAGTENVTGIAGFGAAARAVAGLLTEEADRVCRLRDDLERRLLEAAPDARIFGRDAPRLPNTACVAMPGVRSEVQVMSFDLAGVAVSAGSACSSGKVRPSHVLQAMGVPADLADSSVRVSLGWASTDADVDAFMAAWLALYGRTRASSADRMPSPPMHAIS